MANINIKKELAPKGLQFKPSEFIISDKWCTILTIVSYPKWISPGYLSDIVSNSGVKIVVKHIPLPFSVIPFKNIILMMFSLQLFVSFFYICCKLS